MAWVRAVCGRLESRYRYPKDIVYNNFPWPEASEGQRALFPDSTLADLYDPVWMPPALAKAHGDLDRAVDRWYRAEAFGSDLERVELLFEAYGRLTADVATTA